MKQIQHSFSGAFFIHKQRTIVMEVGIGNHWWRRV